jgi:hypothetical protein
VFANTADSGEASLGKIAKACFSVLKDNFSECSNTVDEKVMR